MAQEAEMRGGIRRRVRGGGEERAGGQLWRGEGGRKGKTYMDSNRIDKFFSL